MFFIKDSELVRASLQTPSGSLCVWSDCSLTSDSKGKPGSMVGRAMCWKGLQKYTGFS